MLLGLALLLCASHAHAQDAHRGPKTLEARPLGVERLLLDGKLDEPAWLAAQVADDFVERVPRTGAKPPVTTAVRVLYDRDAIYVGIRAELLPGEPAPRALNLARDNTRLWSDEAVTIKFDVRNDKRTTVGVAVNPANAQIDFIAVDNGRLFRPEYDAIWESATHVGDGFWSVEVRLPVAALGLPATDGPVVMGFNIARDHNARLADYDWAHLSPEFGPFSSVHYGQLRGIEGMAGGTPISLRPYALGSYRGHNNVGTDQAPDGLDGKVGGSAALRFGDDIWAELTVLTDFAQVDVDDQVLNLNRFPLFFPERRPFFLSGLSVFDFGQTGVAQPFFTRRIGRDADGEEVPILVGTKVYGSAGPFEFGLLDVVTDDTTAPIIDPDAEPDAEPETSGAPGQNWAVARARLNFASPGHVGIFAGALNQVDVLVTDPAVEIPKEDHVTLGADGLVRTAGDRLELTTFGTMSLTNEVQQDGERKQVRGTAGQARVRWLGLVFQPELSMLHVQKAFDPRLGFVRRPGILKSLGTLPIVLRTEQLGLASITLRQTGDFTHDEHVEGLLERTLASAVEVRWVSGWGVDLTAEHGLDRPVAAFELLDGVFIQPDTYEGARLRAKLISPAGRNPDGSLGYAADDAFFSGTSHGFDATMALSANAHHRISIGANLTFISLDGCRQAVDDEGEAVTHCGGLEAGRASTTGPTRRVHDEQLSINGKVSVTPTTKLTTDLTLQLNTQTETAFGQLRARYRYMPGSDLFLVYQEQIGYGARPRAAREYSAAIKVAYRYDSVL